MKPGFERVFGMIVAALVVTVLLFAVLDRAGCGRSEYVPMDTAAVRLKVQVAERDGTIRELLKSKAQDSLVLDSVRKENTALNEKADRKAVVYFQTTPERIAVASDTTMPCQERVDTLLAVLTDASSAIGSLIDVKNRLLNELALERGARKIGEAIITDLNLNAADYKVLIAKLEADIAKLSEPDSWLEDNAFVLGFVSGAASLTAIIIAQ